MIIENRSSLIPQNPRRTAGTLLSPEEIRTRMRDHTTEHGLVSSRWIEIHDPLLLRSIRVHFGGLKVARRALNAPGPRQGVRLWSELAVVNELQRIYRAGGVRMTFHGLRAAGYGSLANAIRPHVGSIERARRLARIPEPEPPNDSVRWDADRVVAQIRGRRRARESLAPKKVPATLYQAALRHCGGWVAALDAAGFDHDEVRVTHRLWTQEQLIARLKRAAHEVAHNPNSPPMSVLLLQIKNPIVKFFGGIEGGLRAAGIDPKTVMRKVLREERSEQDLMVALQAAFGKQPARTSSEFFRTELGKEALAHFGSKTAVIDKIGEKYWVRRYKPLPTADEVIAGLRERYWRNQVMDRSATFREDRRLVLAATKHFSTWRRAMEAAGFGHLVKQGPGGRRAPAPRRARA